MHIALLCHDAGVPLGGPKGASVHLREVAGALLRAGHDVCLCLVRLGESDSAVSELVGHGLRVTALPQPTRAADLMQHWKAQRPDLVWERLALLAPAGAEAANRLGVRHLYEANSPLDQEASSHRGFARAEAARTQFARGFSLSQGTVAVSHEVARWVETLAPPGHPIRVIQNGAHPSFLLPPSLDRLRSARRLLGEGSGFRIGFFGSFRPWHDLEGLVEAVGRLARRRPLRLLLAGRGPLLSTTVERALALGIPVDAPGAVPHADVPALLALTDAVVVPYARADLYFSPLKLLEAMAAGRPVVASATGPCARIVRDGENGLLVPPGDASALSQALERLAADPELARRLGHNARERVREQHLWDHVIRDVLRFAGETPVLQRTP